MPKQPPKPKRLADPESEMDIVIVDPVQHGDHRLEPGKAYTLPASVAQELLGIGAAQLPADAIAAEPLADTSAEGAGEA